MQGGTNVASKLEWTFRRDDAGRLSRLRDPGGRETHWEYEPFDGNPQKLKKLTRKFSGGEVVQEFDPRGRRTLMKDSAGTVRYGWDDLGQLASVQREGGAKIEYERDSLGRLKKYRLGPGNEVSVDYDFLDRVETLHTPAGAITYEYQTGQGKTIRTLPNKVQTVWERAANGQLTSITHADAKHLILAQFTYTYRPDGLTGQVKEWFPTVERTLTFEYDQVQRLIACVDSTGKKWQAEYDPMGNRTKAGVAGGQTRESVYDWAGRLTSLAGEPCEHDASGNLTQATFNGKKQTFEFDHDNRLLGVNQGEVSYQFDGEGCLIARTVRGETTTFTPDPTTDIWRPLASTTGGKKHCFYMWEGRTPLGMIEDGRATFYLEDHLGSARCLVDATGKVVARQDYSPFGAPANPPASNTLTPGFAGLFWDNAASVYLTRGRAYSADLGRFLQFDPQHRVPSGSQKDLSLYAYCGNDPVNLADRNGMASEPSTFDWHRYYLENLVSGLPESFNQNWIATQNVIHALATQGWRGVEFGSQPGSFADQAFLYGGAPAQRQVQMFSGISLAASSVALGAAAAEASQAAQVTRLLRNAQSAASSFFRNTVGSGARGLSYAYDKTSLNPLWRLNIAYRGAGVGEVAFVDEGVTLARGLSAAQKAVTWAVVIPFTTVSAAGPALWWQNRVPATERMFDSNDPLEWTSSALEAAHHPPGEHSQALHPTSNLPGSAGASFYISSIPLSGHEYAAWKAQQLPRPNPTSTDLRNLDHGDHRIAGNTRDGKQSQSSPPPPPSPVGGVYLGGAGKLLAGLQQLKALDFDPKTGNLILLAEDGGDIQLPPLRLDDVVTIFRSVYLHGEGPSVTINPDPENPHGPKMLVVHGKATPDSYPGWILYQADRIMKGYNLGQDNISKARIASKVPGYAGVVHTIFFGGDFGDGQKPGGNWERFWIVPAEVNRYLGAARELTLFDVPLKVKTQKMIWKSGELEEDPKGKSSVGALAFTDWFTKNYELIGDECYLLPPPETGITKPVPVFAELRRIALISAIAEHAHGQGMPLPCWMKDYEAQKVPVDGTTPSLTVPDSETVGSHIREVSIFGGVNLSPADDVVKSFDGQNNLKPLSPANQEFAKRQIALANTLAPEIEKAARGQQPLVPFAVQQDGRHFHAVVLPGADAKALAPCRLAETDLTVSYEGGGVIALGRHFNSFFKTNGPWGAGWTIDLPQLDETKVPISRTDKKVAFQVVPELSTPLNSIRARFSKVARVPSLGAELLVPDSPSEVLALATVSSPLATSAKHKLIFKDGANWYFDEKGQLVAVERKPFTTRYSRDSDGTVRQIIGYKAAAVLATITIKYNAQRLMDSAEAKNSKGEETVTFQYDDKGTLVDVVSSAGKTSYGYERGLVKSVSFSAKDDKGAFAKASVLRDFEYAPNGQLLSEAMADGTRIAYRVEAQDGGSRMIVGSPGEPANAQTVTYDASHRPLEWARPDQTRTRYDYAADGAVKIETTAPGGEFVRTSVSTDGKRKTTQTSDGIVQAEDYDERGNLLGVALNQKPLFKQQWHAEVRGLRGLLHRSSIQSVWSCHQHLESEALEGWNV